MIECGCGFLMNFWPACACLLLPEPAWACLGLPDTAWPTRTCLGLAGPARESAQIRSNQRGTASGLYLCCFAVVWLNLC